MKASSRRLAVLSALMAAGPAACAPVPRGVAFVPAPPAAGEEFPRGRFEGLPNLGRVDDGLWRSGQPTAAGFRSAKALGVRTVVTLRSAHTDRALLAGTGLDYVEIPTHQWDFAEDDLVAFLRVATDPARRPVLVHCAEGRDRTGVAVAAYRRVVEGWSAGDALHEMRSYGTAPWWPNLVGTVRRLEPEALRARVGPLAGRGPGLLR